jgi:hypothetical protein
MVDKEHYCKDSPGNFINENGIINGLLIVFPGNCWLKEAIRRIYLNCVNKTYNLHNSLYVTGPGLLSEIMPLDLKFTTYYCYPDIIKLYLGDVVILIAFKEYRNLMRQFKKKNKFFSYTALWDKKEVYKFV